MPAITPNERPKPFRGIPIVAGVAGFAGMPVPAQGSGMGFGAGLVGMGVAWLAKQAAGLLYGAAVACRKPDAAAFEKFAAK